MKVLKKTVNRSKEQADLVSSLTELAKKADILRRKDIQDVIDILLKKQILPDELRKHKTIPALIGDAESHIGLARRELRAVDGDMRWALNNLEKAEMDLLEIQERLSDLEQIINNN